jgi:hypothetical protein
MEPEVECGVPERVMGNYPIKSITPVETRKTVSHLSDPCLTMIDLIELIGSFSAEIFGVEIRVGGRGEKILGENNPIKSIKSITGSQTAAIWLTTAKKYIVTQ